MNTTQLLSGIFLSVLVLSAFLNTGYRLPAQVHQITAAPVAVRDTIQADSNKTAVEKLPEFPGGIKGLNRFLAKNIKYPKAARRAGHEGKVYVQFVVDRDGKIKDVKVVKGVSPELDQEAARVVSMMPDWTPGVLNGEKVSVRYTLPITFGLNQ